jgi:hypothetical protein
VKRRRNGDKKVGSEGEETRRKKSRGRRRRGERRK